MADTSLDGTADAGLVPWRRLVAVSVLLAALLALAYYGGFVGRPTAGVVDEGDWGAVTDERTEIVTTVWLDNPNPVGVHLGDGLSVDYDVRLNDVALAHGDASGLALPPGNSTRRLRTYVDNDQLPDWWVAFLRDDETVSVDFDAELTVDAGPTVSYTVERNRRMMAGERPVVGSLSAVAERTTGTYTTNVSVGEALGTSPERIGLDRSRTVTVGYEIRNGSATLDSVTRNRTTVVYHLRVHNPGDVPVLASPQGARLRVRANGVTLFRADASALSLRTVGEGDVLAPGETRTVRLALRMDNDRVDDWFTSHVRRGERSAVTARFRLVFEHPLTGEPIELPADGPVTYDCAFWTSILVDNRTAGTSCEGPDGAVPS